MIRIVSSVVLASLVALPAVAQQPFEGTWSLDCANQSGDMVPTVIKDGRFIFFESECSIDQVAPIGSQNQAWNLTVTCSGEGETWSRNVLLALDRDAGGTPRQLIEVDLDDGFVVTRQNCG